MKGKGNGLYAHARLGRYGLAHGILAWARSVVWSEQSGATLMAPLWFRLRIGPFLRRERDKRTYFLLFHSGGALSGLRRLWVLATSAREQVGQSWPASGRPTGKRVFIFTNALADNEKKCFDQVRGYGPLLRTRLIAMTRRRYLPDRPFAPFIAVHIRLGDFAPPADAAALAANNVRLPLDWYHNRLSALRLALDKPVDVLLFSDGSDAELAPLLRLAGVRRAPPAQSVTDLLAMGDALAVIASGSGFSLWGAFLGSAPRISFPGREIVPIYDDPTRDLSSGFDDPIPDSFLAHLRDRLPQPC